jgi:putative membrane protein
MCYWREGVGPWMTVGGVLILVFWASVVGFCIWAVTRLTGRRHNGNGAMAAVRERYARGEISKEEFDRIKKDLS